MKPHKTTQGQLQHAQDFTLKTPKIQTLKKIFF